MTLAAYDHVALPMERVEEMLAFYAGLGFTVDDQHAPILWSVAVADMKINLHGPKLWHSERFALRGPTARPGCGDLCFVWEGSHEDLVACLDAVGAEVISAETSHLMPQLLRLVVASGTGRMADAEGFLVGGKTGTADKPKGRGYARNSRIASFAGAFPMDDPRYVVFAMVDEPKPTKETYGYATGGWVAAPLVGRLVERIGPLLGIAPRDNGDVMIEQMIADVESRAEGRQLASN